MDKRRNARRYLVVVLAVAALVGSTVGMVALAQPDEPDIYTGCLNERWGTLTRVAIGTEPARPCRHNQVQITWDRAGAALESRLAALEERVAQATVGAPSPVELFAAATVNVITIQASVGPVESVTQVGTAHYRVTFGEDVFGDGAPNLAAFVSLASNSFDSDPGTCTYEVYAADQLDVLCWAEGSGEPADAEWSLMVFAVPDS